MNKLRGSFSAQPFEKVASRLSPLFDPALGRKKARLHRLKRKGLTPPSSKAEARKLIEKACQTHPIRRIDSP
jgi:hypothetical protein